MCFDGLAGTSRFMVLPKISRKWMSIASWSGDSTFGIEVHARIEEHVEAGSPVLWMVKPLSVMMV